MASPFASVVPDPLVGFEPVTVKRTVTPGTGRPIASFTVAVTQCCVPTGFVAAAGVSVSVAGGPAEHGVPAAGVLRYDEKSIFPCPSTPSPLPEPSGAPGPLAAPHQFDRALMVSLPGTG